MMCCQSIHDVMVIMEKETDWYLAGSIKVLTEDVSMEACKQRTLYEQRL